jgi:hypothetical protein
LPLKVAFSYDGARIAAGDRSGQVLVWTLSPGKGKGKGPVELTADP